MAPRKRQQNPETQSRSQRSDSTEKCDTQKKKETGVPWLRMLLRLVLVAATIMLLRYIMADQQSPVLASARDSYERVHFDLPCSKDYEADRERFKSCTPTRCSRVVMDNLVEKSEAQELLRIAKVGLAFGGSNGGASILDLHSGALSKGDKFINIYTIKDEHIFSEEDFRLYKNVKNKIHGAVASEFGLPKESLYLTKPTFFSRMTTKSAKTIHDEYWHSHIDKETYGSFDYTSLLYLTDYGEDFTGGRFIFVDKNANRTVEPKLGRVSFFTSGSENVHYVEKLESGTRYAITVSFTCDPAKAISDPELQQ